jgi:hypothetical protein
LLVYARLQYQNKIGNEFNAINKFISKAYGPIEIKEGRYYDGDQSYNITPDLSKELLPNQLRFMLSEDEKDELRLKNPERLEAMDLENFDYS